MAQITFENKVKIDDDPSLPAVNKVRDVDMNEIKSVVNENDTEQQALSQQLTNITGKILWTNPNPSSEMGANTNINLSSSDYDFLVWIFDLNINIQPGIYSSGICLKGQNTRLIAGIANATDNTATRDLTYSSDTKYVAGDGYLKAVTQSRRCVPIYVIGFKFGLFN